MGKKPADMDPEELARMEWKHVHDGFVSCKEIMEANGTRYSWLDPLIDMAKDRMNGA